jgi:hypothetical protein
MGTKQGSCTPVDTRQMLQAHVLCETQLGRQRQRASGRLCTAHEWASRVSCHARPCHGLLSKATCSSRRGPPCNRRRLSRTCQAQQSWCPAASCQPEPGGLAPLGVPPWLPWAAFAAGGGRAPLPARGTALLPDSERPCSMAASSPPPRRPAAASGSCSSWSMSVCMSQRTQAVVLPLLLTG